MKPPTPETDTRHWRSLEELTASPEALAELAERRAREFPAGAVEPPDGPTRRTMLGLMGASMALAGLTSCRRPEQTIVPYVNAPETTVPGIPKQYASTMPLGTDAFGVLVTSHEGRPTKIEGNELHPDSRGAASVWMQAAILGLYDPDRSRQVLRRGESGNLEPSTWEDFVDFWGSVAYDLVDNQGAGTAVLIEPYTSPTLARLAERFRRRFDRLRWVVWSPAGDENLFEGLRLATGRAGRPIVHLEKARTILCLDADLLATEGRTVAQAKGFAARRRPGDAMSRLYVVEAGLSLTGTNADHRLRLPCRRIPAFAAALAVELQRQGLPLQLPAGAAAPELPEEIGSLVAAVARDLAAAGSEALVATGRSQPPEVHALVHAINQALGAVGNTVTVAELTDVAWGRTADLAELAAALDDGTVDKLLILGGNPAHTAPADLRFAEALGKAASVVHLSSHVDETSKLAEWHLPQSHWLESWGDARAADGTPSVVQPLIAPLFDSRSPVEMLAILANDEESPGLTQVRITWSERLGSDGFDSRFRRVLHDGVAPGEMPAGASPAGDGGAGLIEEVADPAAALERAFALAAEGAGEGGLEAVFRTSLQVHDGRFANVAWLQELPDPVTKITWDNAALMSPETARDLGVANGEKVRLNLGERSVEAPVFVLPGQADGCVVLPLGYGRTAAGRVGNGVGFNTYQLRGSASPWAEGGLAVEKIGGRHELVQTQEHWRMEGRPIVREATLAHFHEEPDFATKPDEETPPLESLWEEKDYGEGHRWGMTIDLSACIGCNACVVACQSENNVPVVGREQVGRGREMQWLRVDRYFRGDEADPQVVFQPVPCQHCENAPCEQVCPVAATVHDAEGLNVMVYNRCIGTRYCSNNCPYKVRRFNFFNYTKATPELLAMAMNPDVTVRSRGVMEKCTYCLQRISRAKATAKLEERPMRDGDVVTACQQTCPADAIVFGDLNDEESRVGKLKREPRNYELLAELNNKPRTSYLGKIRNPNPEWGVA